jgi:hypothetical protein
MLAADAVTAVVTGTNLSITGDGGDDTFLVAGDGTAGDVVITGFTSSGGNTTLINGNPSVTLTGVTGNVTINLGTGTTGGATVSVADLTVGRNLSMTGNAGDDDTIDVGTVAPATTPSPLLPTNAVTVTGNLTIRAGNGDGDSITIGETPTLAGDVVTVSGDMSVTVGNGGDTITELSLAVSRDETINAGSGDDSITIGGPTVAGSGVTIGRGLSISVGSGDDSITEESTSVARTESISLGSGDDTVALGAPSLSVTASVSPAVHAAAIAQVVADRDVSVGRDLDIQMGTGDSSLTATGVQIGDTLLITGGGGFGFGGGYGGGFGGFGGGFFGRFVNTADDTITLDDVTSEGAGIFTGFSTTDVVSITGSTFDDLGVGLGSGSGSLSIGTTATNHSTTLVGLGTANTYTDLGGNSFTNLHTYGLTPAPTTTVVAPTPAKEGPGGKITPTFKR